MRTNINLFLILLLTLAACSRDNVTRSTGSLNGKWKLVSYHDLTTGTIEFEPNVSRSIIIAFVDNGTRGNMNGQTVTNAVDGEYELLPENKMKTLSFGGTKVGEPNWGYKFWDAIHAASSYERQSNRLYIYYNVDKEKMEFIKE